MNHPAQKRAWLQTAGFPVEPIHADLRAAFDGVHAVEYIGGACFKLRDPAGRQIGIIQFQGAEQAAVDAAVKLTTERLATGETKPVDYAAGDTVVRELNMNDAEDAAMARAAMANPQAFVSVPDEERADLPPIELPDYVPTEAEIAAAEAARDERAARNAQSAYPVRGLPGKFISYSDQPQPGDDDEDRPLLGVAVAFLVTLAAVLIALAIGYAAKH